MAAFSGLPEEALEAWHWVRHSLVGEVKNLAEEDLAARPTSKSRSGFELGYHIVEVAQMMCGELAKPDGDFRRKPYPKLIAEYAGHLQLPSRKDDLVLLLETTHAEGEKRLRQAGELRMLQHITRFDGKQGTRLAWLYHGIAHEEYHNGQLAVYARMRGNVPALTQLIEGSHLRVFVVNCARSVYTRHSSDGPRHGLPRRQVGLDRRPLPHPQAGRLRRRAVQGAEHGAQLGSYARGVGDRPRPGDAGRGGRDPRFGRHEPDPAQAPGGEAF